MIIAAEKDYFDVRGAIEAYERLVPIYRLLDAEQNLQLFIGPNTHGYSKPNREAMYRFFHQQVGKSSEVVEPLLTVETDETLRCTVTGQVAELSSRTVMSFTAERAKSLALQRGQLGADEVVRRVRSMIPVIPHRISDYQILRPVPRKGYPSSHFTCYALETEPDVRVIVTRLSDQAHLSRPPVGERKVLLYVAHHSSDVELRESSSLRRLIADQPDVEVFAIDVRGIGESRPDTCGENQFLTPYGNDYFYAAHSIMLAQPLPLQRAFDLLRVIQWLKSLGRHELHLAADGWGTIPAMLAAVISPELQRITLENAPASYQRIAEEEHYDWPLSSFIPAVLERFDLPDCYRVLESRTLKLTTR